MTEVTPSIATAIAQATPPAGGSQDDGGQAVWAEIDTLRRSIHLALVGQQHLADMLLVAMLSDGHLLIEGPPGLAKTSALESLTSGLEGPVRWRQVSPDMDPARLLEQVDPTADDHSHTAGVNRWPACLLIIEDMDQAPADLGAVLRQIMKPRSPDTGIEEGVPLAGADLVIATRHSCRSAAPGPSWFDLFAFCVQPRVPGYAAERAILRRARQALRTGGPQQPVAPRIGPATIRDARRRINDLYLSLELECYLVHLVIATRVPTAYSRDLVGWLHGGVSPRATLALERGARAKAWLDGRDYVAPDDIQWIAPAVLRHRIRLTEAIEADGRTPDDYIANWLASVPVP